MTVGLCLGGGLSIKRSRVRLPTGRNQGT